MTRWEVVQAASAYFSDCLPDSVGEKNLSEGVVPRVLALSDQNISQLIEGVNWSYVHPSVEGKLSMRNYLDLLERSRFYLACPGASFPVSHNLPESMLMGCVPVLQYGKTLPKALEDGLNCLMFDDEKGLTECLAKAVTMEEQEWLSMSIAAREYARNYLNVGCFSRRFKEEDFAKKRILRLFDFLAPKL